MSFDAIPYVANQPSPQGFNVPESTFGILVHGNIELTASEEVGGVPIATSPCDGSFVFDYRASVANGALQVKIANSGGLGDSAFAGGGQGQVGDPENVCTYLRNLLIGDSQGNGLNGQPPLLTKVALGQLQTAIQNAVQGSFLHVANGAFTMDVSTLALDSGDPSPSDAMCHHAGTHPSCRGVEPFLLPVAVKGAQLFNPSLDETQATAALVGTFEGGIDSPDVGNGNWTCDVNDHCNLKLPLSRLIGQPDAVDIVPFESFTDFSNPSLLAFFMLEAFDSPLAPAKNLCTRRPVAARPGGFYNRLYSSVHVRNASCGNKDEYARWNHEPAQQNESCTTDQDCCNLDPTYCDPDTLKLDVCKNGRCDFNNAYACQNGAWCFPWDECKFDTRAGRSGCVPIGSCQPDDPFRFGICPAVPFNGGTVATYCNNNGECWRQ